MKPPLLSGDASGVGRVDGDEGKVAPVFAALQGRRLGGVGLLQGVGAEDGRNRVCGNRDHADGTLALERTEPLRDLALRRTEPDRLGHFDGNEVTVLGVASRVRRDTQFLAEHLLVDRLEPAAAARHGMEDAEHAMFRPVENADDAAAVADAVFLRGLLDAQQHAIADAGRDVAVAPLQRRHADFRRRAVFVLVPFVRRRDQVAIAVAGENVGKDGIRQRAGMMQFFVPLLDAAVVGQFAQHALEVGAPVVLEVEGTGDFPNAGLAGTFGDKGQQFGLGGKGGLLSGFSVQWRSLGCIKCNY
jgi:hypothetical protein